MVGWSRWLLPWFDLDAGTPGVGISCPLIRGQIKSATFATYSPNLQRPYRRLSSCGFNKPDKMRSEPIGAGKSRVPCFAQAARRLCEINAVFLKGMGEAFPSTRLREHSRSEDPGVPE